MGSSSHIEGVVEMVNLRTTQIRAPTGELLTVPNGEIRLVRNFSRGRFSVADVRLMIETENLHQAVDLLTALREEAVTLLPNLLEPWQVISVSGEMGQQTELTLVARRALVKRPKCVRVCWRWCKNAWPKRASSLAGRDVNEWLALGKRPYHPYNHHSCMALFSYRQDKPQGFAPENLDDWGIKPWGLARVTKFDFKMNEVHMGNGVYCVGWLLFGSAGRWLARSKIRRPFPPRHLWPQPCRQPRPCPLRRSHL
ncbi:MAG: mechanosensitive ion channel family protein [Chloroflexi bacterium]|nr:mechanosensitive ion channel family protein [Chloroflexota bacterium]